MQEYLLKVNVYCIVLRPLEQLPMTDGRPTTVSPKDSALRGEAVLAVARSFDGPVVVKGSHTHKIQKFRLSGDCFCVIRRELTGLHSGISPK